MLIILNNPVCLHQAGAVLSSKKVSSKVVGKKYGIKMMQKNQTGTVVARIGNAMAVGKEGA